MVRAVFAGVALVALSTIVVAQSDPIASRRNIMKGVGAAARTGGQMAKGDIPFDVVKAQDVLKTFAAASENFHTYFPDSSKTGGDTTAAPKIWENPDEFKARFVSWGEDIKKASDETKDLPTFRTAFGNVGKACGACHNTFRIKT